MTKVHTSSHARHVGHAHSHHTVNIQASKQESDGKVSGGFQWPPKGRIGEITIKFGKPQSWVDKKGWTFDVTWHRTEGQPPDYKHCKIEDWDRGGHGCPGATAYLFSDSDLGERRSMTLVERRPLCRDATDGISRGLDEDDRERGEKSAMQFRRVNNGWLGAAILESGDTSAGQGLMLVHLNDLGKATVGLWVPAKNKFYFMNEKSFLSDPNAKLKPVLEKDLPPGGPLPAPFQYHAKDLEDPPGFLPFRYRGERHVKCEMNMVDGKPGWRLQDFVIGDGNKEFHLPLDGQKSITSPARGIFKQWERGKNCWVSASEQSGYPETFGLIGKSRLKLALYDNGGRIFAVEEERTNGEKRIYRLDSKWLNDFDGDPAVVSVKRLGPGETFESFYTSERASEGLPLVDLKRGNASPSDPWSATHRQVRPYPTLGGVAV